MTISNTLTNRTNYDATWIINRFTNHPFLYILKFWNSFCPEVLAVRFCDALGQIIGTLTYNELYELSISVSYQLQHHYGVQKGDVILLCFTPGLEFITNFFGCLLSGVISVPIPPPDPANNADVNRLRFIIDTCRPKLILTNQQYSKLVWLVKAKLKQRCTQRTTSPQHRAEDIRDFKERFLCGNKCYYKLKRKRKMASCQFRLPSFQKRSQSNTNALPFSSLREKSLRNQSRYSSDDDDDKAKTHLPWLLDWIVIGPYKRYNKQVCLKQWVSPSISLSDPLLIQYTSGSTKEPTGVSINYINLIVSIHSCMIAMKGASSTIDDPQKFCFDPNRQKVETFFDCLVKRQQMNRSQTGHHLRFVTWLPLYHDMGLVGSFLSNVFSGSELIMISPMDFMKNPSIWLQLLSTYECSGTVTPNFGLDLIIRKVSDKEVQSFKLHHTQQCGFLCGAEPIKVKTVLKFLKKFESVGIVPLCFNPSYGLAENTLIVTSQAFEGQDKEAVIIQLESYDPKIGSKMNIVGTPKRLSQLLDQKLDVHGNYCMSCGVPVAYTDIAIVNPKSRCELPSKHIGEIWVSSLSKSTGYWKKSELTEKNLHASYKILNERNNENLWSAPSFIRTGDLGCLFDISEFFPDTLHHKEDETDSLKGDIITSRSKKSVNHLFIVGRLKDLVIFRGQNFHAHDIERTIEEFDPQLIRAGRVVVFSLTNSQKKNALKKDVGGRDIKGEKNGRANGNWTLSAIPTAETLIEGDCEDDQIVSVIEMRGHDIKCSELKKIFFKSRIATYESELKSLGLSLRQHIIRVFGVPLDVVVFASPHSIPITSSGKVRRAETRTHYIKNVLKTIYHMDLNETGCSDHKEEVSPRDRANTSINSILHIKKTLCDILYRHQIIIAQQYTTIETYFETSDNQNVMTCDAEMLSAEAFFDKHLFEVVQANSLTMLELGTAIEQTFMLNVSPTFLFENSTINSLSHHIYELQQQQQQQQHNSKVQVVHLNWAKSEHTDTKFAIIGAACRFPANKKGLASCWSLKEFWNEILCLGTDTVVQPIQIADDAANMIHHESSRAASTSADSFGSFLPMKDLIQIRTFSKFCIDSNNNTKFLIETQSLSSHQKLVLTTGCEALDLAGFNAIDLRDMNIGIFIGCIPTALNLGNHRDMVNHEKSTFDFLNCQQAHNSNMKETKNLFNPNCLMAGATSLIANYFSYYLGLTGPSMAIDTSCSSSLVALDVAIQYLKNEVSDKISAAIVGGVNLMLDRSVSRYLNAMNVLAPDGRCKTFSDKADGYGRGEGCGAVIVMPWSQTVKNWMKLKNDTLTLKKGMSECDYISPLCLINGTYVNHNKHKSGGLTIPNGASQIELVTTCLKKSNLFPDDINYMECHGTGTKLGDPIEVNSLGQILKVSTQKKTGVYHLGSVKANIGHLEGAAGIAGLIKLVLTLGYQTATPIAHLKTLNPLIDTKSINYQFCKDECQSLFSKRSGGGSLYGSVTSMGIGGTNAICILQGFEKTLILGCKDSDDGATLLFTKKMACWDSKKGERSDDETNGVGRPWAASVVDSPVPTPKNTIQEISQTLRHTLEKMIEMPITNSLLDVPLTNLALTSLDFVVLTQTLSKKLQMQLPSTTLFNYTTIRKVEEHLHGLATDLNCVVKLNHQPLLKAQIEQQKSEVAVVAMSCRFPGRADNPNSLFNLLFGKAELRTTTSKDPFETVELTPPDRWHPYDLNFLDNKTINHGAFLSSETISLFDYEHFLIQKNEATSMDPNQRLFLTVTSEAFHRLKLLSLSRYISNTVVDSSHDYYQPNLKVMDSELLTGVFVGHGNSEWSLLKDRHMDLTAYSATGLGPSLIAGRTSYVFNLTGPAMVIDTGCSSSLVAVDVALKYMQKRIVQRAVVGGVSLMLTQLPFFLLSTNRMLSPDGRCRPFDENANGYGRGEGCGVIILQTLSDCLAKKQPVLAVLKSSNTNQDGQSSGLAAPNSLAQRHLINQCLHSAKKTPSDIRLVECHGTGTQLGDSIEIDSLLNVFSQQKTGLLLIGAMKANINHLESASGIASLIKTIILINYGSVPPIYRFQNLNHHIQSVSTKCNHEFILKFPKEKVELSTPETSKRSSGVSSFSFCGTNCHVIVDGPILEECGSATNEESTYDDASQLNGGEAMSSSGRLVMSVEERIDKNWKSQLTEDEVFLGKHFVYFSISSTYQKLSQFICNNSLKEECAHFLMSVPKDFTMTFVKDFEVCFQFIKNHLPVDSINELECFLYDLDEVYIQQCFTKNDYLQWIKEGLLYCERQQVKHLIDSAIDHIIKCLLEFIGMSNFKSPLISQHSFAFYQSMVIPSTPINTLQNWHFAFGPIQIHSALRKVDIWESYHPVIDQKYSDKQQNRKKFDIPLEHERMKRTFEILYGDHTIFNVAIVPAAGLLELMASFLIHYHEQQRKKHNLTHVTLTSVELLKPLSWRNEEELNSQQQQQQQQLRIEVESNSIITLSLLSGRPHAVPICRAEIKEATRHQHEFTETAENLALFKTSGKQFYEELRNFGYHYGVSYQTIKDYFVTKDRSKIHFSLELPKRDDAMPYQQNLLYPPAVLDGAFQSALILLVTENHLSFEKEKYIFLPIFIERVVIEDDRNVSIPVGHDYIGYCEFLHPVSIDSTTIKVNVLIWKRSPPPRSEPIFCLEGLVYKKVKKEIVINRSMIWDSSSSFNLMSSIATPPAVDRLDHHNFVIEIEEPYDIVSSVSDYTQNFDSFMKSTEILLVNSTTMNFELLQIVKSDPLFLTHTTMSVNPQNFFDSMKESIQLCILVYIVKVKSGAASLIDQADADFQAIQNICSLLKIIQSHKEKCSIILNVIRYQTGQHPEFLATGISGLLKSANIELQATSSQTKNMITTTIFYDCYTYQSLHSIMTTTILNTVQQFQSNRFHLESQLVVKAETWTKRRIKSVEKTDALQESKARESVASSQSDMIPTNCWLITGGCGRLSQIVTKWLILKKQVKHVLLLTSRENPVDCLHSSLRKYVKFDGAAVIDIKQKTSQSQIHMLTCNITEAIDDDSLHSLFERINGNIDVIIHMAGVIEDSSIVNMDIKSSKCWRPKVVGFINVMNAFTKHNKTSTSRRPMIIFSSTASLIGNFGQCHYSAANGFLDSLARHRCCEEPTLSIQWGPWSSGVSESVAQIHKRLGISIIDEMEGLQVFEELVNHFFNQRRREQQQILPLTSNVGYQQVNWTLIHELYGHLPPLYSRNQIRPAIKKVSKLLKDENKQSREEEVRLILEEAAEKILGQAKMPMTVPLLEGGGFDSLTLIELRRFLVQRLSIDISPTALFDHPTLKDIQQYLIELLNDNTSTTTRDGRLLTKADIQTDHQLTTTGKDVIAILGMACHFPKATNLFQFWNNLKVGRDCISQIPEERWNIDQYYNTDMSAPGAMYTKEGGFCDEFELLDLSLFNISRTEAAAMDPQQKWFLKIGLDSLYESGLVYSDVNLKDTDSSDDRQRILNPHGSLWADQGEIWKATGVFVGVCLPDWTYHLDYKNTTVYSGTGLVPSIVSNRFSYSFGFHGPSLSIDTACSSSLVALNSGVEALKLNKCKRALIGGVQMNLSPFPFIAFCKARMLSIDGRCKTFDASANGYGRGEGCGVVVLERMTRDKYMRHYLNENNNDNKIWGFIEGSAVCHDGKCLNLTSPNGTSQRHVIVTCLKDADLQPKDMHYLESHGTGTQLGDPIEANCISAIFGPEKKICRQVLSLGAVKTNIGHLEGAAGIAGFIKLVLCLTFNLSVPNVHFNKLNNLIKLPPNIKIPTDSGMICETALMTTSDHSLIGGVSSFGFGGTLGHVIAGVPAKNDQKSLLTSFPYDALLLHKHLKPNASRKSEFDIIFLEATGIDISHIDDDSNLAVVGFDSLAAMALKENLSKQLNIDVPIAAFTSNLSTRRQLMALLSSAEDNIQVKTCASQHFKVDWLEPLTLYKPQFQLFCFPYGGGSTEVFSLWREHFPSTIEIIPVVLPGRGPRFNEPPMHDIPSLIQNLLKTFIPFIKGSRQIPYSFLGVSVGGIIAYELIKELERNGIRLPQSLMPICCTHPSVYCETTLKAVENYRHKAGSMKTTLSLDKIATTLLKESSSRNSNVDHPSDDQNEAEQFMFDFLSAANYRLIQRIKLNKEFASEWSKVFASDAVMALSYQENNKTNLSVPIIAIEGSNDMITQAIHHGVSDWKHYTQDHFEYHLIQDGDHYLVHDKIKEIHQIIFTSFQTLK